MASVGLTLLASSTAVAPLYATYQRDWGFSDLIVTVTFGTYALAVLASLTVVGSLSDHVGRRRPLIVCLCAQALVMVLFAFAGGVSTLLLSRALQGLVTGASLGAIGAAMVDFDARRGPVGNAASLMGGVATGSLLTALLMQFLPAPTQLVYFVLGGAFVLQAAGVARLAETSAMAPGARASLVPRLKLPTQVRGAVLIATPALVAVWALVGFYASLGPQLAQLVASSHSIVIGGAALFVLAGSSAVAILLLHAVEARRLALFGALATAAGAALLLAGVRTSSLPLFSLGTVVAGAGVGTGFQGGLRTSVADAALPDRAGVVAVVYVIVYLALAIPAVVAGVLVVNSSLAQAADDLSAAVIVLAALSSVGLVWMIRRDTGPPAAGVAA